MGLLDGELADIIGGALDFLFLDATLTRDVQGVGTDPADPPAPTQVTYSCKAIHEDWGAYLRANGLVLQGERKLLVLANSLATVPMPLDRIAIDNDGLSFTIVAPGAGQPPVSTGPAKAVWVLRALGSAVAPPVVPDEFSLDFSDADNSGYLVLLEDI